MDGNNSHDPGWQHNIISWIQNSGNPTIILNDANSPTPNFIAPQVDNNSTVTVKLIVTDNSDDTNIDYVNILIRNTNDTIIPPIEGKITLDKIPSQINAGSIFVFSGILNIVGQDNYQNSYIQIKDFNNGSDDILSFSTSDSDGRYVTEWTAAARETPYEVYAIYEDGYGHSLRSDSQTFQVTETENVIRSDSQSDSQQVISGPYLPIQFNDYKKDGINVYVVAKDEPSVAYVPTAVKAIEYWSELLKQRSHNPGAWNFNIFSSRDFPSAIRQINTPLTYW